MFNFCYLWHSLILTICFSSYGQLSSDFDWDYIVFSQRWPLSTCAEWEETKPGNVCNLPTNRLTWTVHGIWPTKSGTRGPISCNSAIHFDPNQLTPMLDDLKEHWTNVEANTKQNSFWEHEWKKHGTCASILPQFDSVTNYFSRGLKFNKDYNLSTILESNGVVPNNNGYNLQDVYNTIMNSTGKEPSIQCVTDKNTKESFISEIRICLNKTLDLIVTGLTA
ncbi:ribonuclease X25 isoform X2 [Rhynchophorus ferrugineus]|uniref:Uncharacterized protein n=2 Tax=Rhynchophorus ferrugineus TaxID=354439 RepID=A0A834IXN4_RHYFE|nr:hypothetical protein GWI33_001664 [Rhynchophorus ferrugineus]